MLVLEQEGDFSRARRFVWAGAAGAGRSVTMVCMSDLSDSRRQADKPTAPASAREATMPLVILPTIARNGDERKTARVSVLVLG
jgi:hypothetical protein